MDPIDQEDPSENIEQIAGLGRQDSAPSPHPMITLNTGTDMTTPLFGGANQVQEVMSPSDTTEGRQEQQEGGQQRGVRQPAQQHGREAMTGPVSMKPWKITTSAQKTMRCLTEHRGHWQI